MKSSHPMIGMKVRKIPPALVKRPKVDFGPYPCEYLFVEQTQSTHLVLAKHVQSKKSSARDLGIIDGQESLGISRLKS